jgi:O-antigen ligase
MLQNPNRLELLHGEPLTKTAIYRLCIAFTVFAFVADLNFFIARSDYNATIKYIYTAALLLLMLMYLIRWKSFDTSTLAPLLALIFFLISSAVLLVNLAIYGEKASYASAFTSSLVFATAAFVPPGVIVLDGRRVLRHLLWLFSFGTACFLVEALMRFSGFFKWVFVYSKDLEPTRTIVCILALSLSILLRKALFCFLLSVMIGVGLVLEPKSTLAISLVVCGSLAVALRMRSFRTARLIGYGVLTVAAAGPLVLYFFFDDISQIIQAADSYIKEDLLSGQSDTTFRLAILKLAFEELSQSFLFGNGLNGETTVLLAREFAFWQERGGMAMIHSDFVIVLTQAGFVGYVLFICFFYAMLRARSHMLATALNTEVRILTALSVVALVALIIYCSFNPFLSYFETAHPIWMLLFISEIARKSIPTTAPALRASDRKMAIDFKFAQ